MPEIEKSFVEVKAGGIGRPADCVARHRVAIIIPFRDRPQHLQTLLYNLHPILLRQQIDYQIFVIEQEGKWAPWALRQNWPDARRLLLLRVHFVWQKAAIQLQFIRPQNASTTFLSLSNLIAANEPISFPRFILIIIIFFSLFTRLAQFQGNGEISQLSNELYRILIQFWSRRKSTLSSPLTRYPAAAENLEFLLSSTLNTSVVCTPVFRYYLPEHTACSAERI